MSDRDDITRQLVENIRLLMDKRGISASRLAELAGLNPTAVYDILSGKSRNPRLDTIHKIATALTVPVYMLLEPLTAVGQRNEMMLIFELLSEEQRQMILASGRSWIADLPVDPPASGRNP